MTSPSHPGEKSPATFLNWIRRTIFLGHFQKYHNTLFVPPKIFYQHCFHFLLGLTMLPRENKSSAKFWRDKQRILWVFWKWPITVDYYSSFIKIDHLTNKTSNEILSKLKQYLARHGLLTTLISDDGPPFNYSAFADLTWQYGFEHVNSSPGFAEPNGKV